MQTIPTLDLYRELEVDPAATTETIDAAWKSLLKRHHPDVAVDQAAAMERVKRLNLAHDWLTDPVRRALYDRARPRRTIVTIPRAPGSRAGRTPRTVSPNPPDVAADASGTPHRASDAGAASGAAERGDQPARNSAAAGRPSHNPYAEYATVARPTLAAGSAPGDDPSRPRPAPRLRVIALAIPLALVSVILVVAVSSFLASVRPGSSVVADDDGSGAPSGGAAQSVPSGSAVAAVVDPRRLAPPDLRAALPKECAGADVGRAFQFESRIGAESAMVYVVACDASRSFGPIVYAATSGGWHLEARGGIRQGSAYQGFSGSLTGTSPDEFGIAWTRGDGVTTTVTLYRLANGLHEFWDSSSIGLAWSLARFTYAPASDPTAPGSLVVESADMRTGTANCPTCGDHQMYREVYAWDRSSPAPRLRMQTRVPDGLGPRP